VTPEVRLRLTCSEVLRRTDPEFNEVPGGWSGHWEKPVPIADNEPAGMPWAEALSRELVEEGRWETVDEAITWGRERSDHVLVYLGYDIDSIYSAGEIHETEGPSPGDSGRWPTWPPPPDVWPGVKT
jgi:hypothetical protein